MLSRMRPVGSHMTGLWNTSANLHCARQNILQSLFTYAEIVMFITVILHSDVFLLKRVYVLLQMI